ncbi:Crp/Fnr family transcriptional regulator [Carboxylicivirga caseinilyticus]|uniref:Crp/Fnr family transcriptional regulator n=1 Tax=Carboxylicivirga caseinilyticus TaxID=3417572 RepID=UPI003D358D9B|nr:Crp/Fnr family transcriptional regulator [Marinilabiliaceae bacterium A049]
MSAITQSEYELLYDFLSVSAPVSDELFLMLKKAFKKKCYNKGDSILREGEIETRSKLVMSGVVHQYIFEDDEPVTINITPKGLAFNCIKSYVEGSPSIEIHEAITDVELLYIEKGELEEMAKQSQELSYLLYKIYETILADRENRTLMLQYRNPTKRFQLFHEIVERAHWILGDTPDKYIASYLNMTPQQYSKEKRMAAKKLS